MLTADAFICTKSPAARGWEESPGDKMSDKISRNGPWVLDTRVFSQGKKLTERLTPMLINT